MRTPRPDSQRDTIRAAFFDGSSYAELAAQRGVPLGTIKSRVRRGLARMKAQLEDVDWPAKDGALTATPG